MPSKYYAVRKGKTPGIYKSWDGCKAQVDGFSGAEYKSFKTEDEALTFLSGNNGTNKEVKFERNTSSYDVQDSKTIIAYVDGSYNNNTQEFSYGMVILRDGQELKFSEKIIDNDLAAMRNVAGEIKGAEAAMRYALSEKCEKVIIYYDYEGISKWCLGDWQAKKDGTKAYKEFYDSIKGLLKVEFVKVKGHSNDKYNDMADILAKQALGLE